MTRVQILQRCILLVLLLLLGGGAPAVLAQDAGAPDGAPDGAPGGALDGAPGGARLLGVNPAFTFQGVLERDGQPYTGACDFRFSLWDEPAGGTMLFTENNFNGLAVEGGAFSVVLAFLNQFTGDERYVQTAVRCTGDADFVTLAPRQLLTPVPYAMGLRPGAAMRSAAQGDGFFVEKVALDSVAIHGKATLKGGTGVLGESKLWAGVWGQSEGATGVVGISLAKFNSGVYGQNLSEGFGVYGKALVNAGVYGESTRWFGVYGKSEEQTGVVGESTSHDGVRGTTAAADRVGVRGVATGEGGVGVWGQAVTTGVYGVTAAGRGVWGASTTGTGVYGASGQSSGLAAGVVGENSGAIGTGVLGLGYVGVEGRTNGTATSQAVLGDNDGSNSLGHAGYFNGRVTVVGNLIKGGGSFQIDHPLDPRNKYLSHSFVESPDMKNIYDGVVVLDANGEATVQLPDWFEALNRDFRYQLTTVGGYAPVYVAREVSGNQFGIAGGTPGLKVSWQVTGIRHDPYAEQNRIVVEQVKPPAERGKYLYPAAYGLPMSEGIAARQTGGAEATGDQP